jgi:hypothetical protein
MADVSNRRSTSSPAGRLLVAALLAPAVVLPLCVPLYAREDPTLFGFPFFYWFQFALIVAAGALTFSAHLVARAINRRDRVAHGLAPEPGPDPGPR